MLGVTEPVDDIISLCAALSRLVKMCHMDTYDMANGRTALLELLFDFRDSAVRVFGDDFMDMCKFHQMLHLVDVADNYGPLYGTSTCLWEAFHRVNKQVLCVFGLFVLDFNFIYFLPFPLISLMSRCSIPWIGSSGYQEFKLAQHSNGHGPSRKLHQL